MRRGRQLDGKDPQRKLYVEGAGHNSEALHTALRQAFAALLQDAGVERRPRVVACGGRVPTLKDFKNAFEQRTRIERAFLLVDSESAVAEGDSVWDHLKKEDNWERPEGAKDGSAFLMIQCMETWLVADVESHKACFPQAFNEKALEKWPDLEAVPKRTILERLDQATRADHRPDRATRAAKRYAKGPLSFEILGRVKASRLEAACPAARRFLEAMRAL